MCFPKILIRAGFLTSDLRIEGTFHYSPPLYQLSYRRSALFGYLHIIPLECQPRTVPRAKFEPATDHQFKVIYCSN